MCTYTFQAWGCLWLSADRWTHPLVTAAAATFFDMFFFLKKTLHLFKVNFTSAIKIKLSFINKNSQRNFRNDRMKVRIRQIFFQPKITLTSFRRIRCFFSRRLCARNGFVMFFLRFTGTFAKRLPKTTCKGEGFVGWYKWISYHQFEIFIADRIFLPKYFWRKLFENHTW